MYRRPKDLDKRITDALFEDLMDVASIEAGSAISFGMFDVCFERAVLAAAMKTLDASCWIPVSEKLPEYESDVLVSNGFVFVASLRENFGNNVWYTSDSDYATGITHWQPLPELPLAEASAQGTKEEKNGNDGKE